MAPPGLQEGTDFVRLDVAIAQLPHDVVKAAVNAGVSPEDLRQHMTRTERRWLSAGGKIDAETFRSQMSTMLHQPRQTPFAAVQKIANTARSDLACPKSWHALSRR